MSNRKVSKDVSDNIIAGAVMASSVLMSGAARIIEAHASDTKKVTVNKSSYEIPVEIGAFWFLVDTATHVDSATDIDTGTVAATTAYYLYAVTDESTISFKTSLSAANPTGYDAAHSKLLGGFTTDGSKDITATTIWDVKQKTATLTDHGVLVGSGTDPITALAVGTNGQVLVGSTGADPVFAAITDGEGIDTTLGAGTLTIACEDATASNKGVAVLPVLTNLIPNSQRRAMSGCTLANVGSEISVSAIASGVCTTAATEGLAIGKLVKFGAGGSTANAVYEVTAVTANTNFTIHDTSITDATAVTCYEQKRAYVAADTLGPDGTTKTLTLDWTIVEQDSTHGKGYYVDMFTKGADTAEYANVLSITNRADLDKFKGQVVAFGMAGYSVTATDNLKIQIYDGVTAVTSSAFWGADALSWKEITQTVATNATELTFRVLLDGDTNDVAYGSFYMGVLGSSIGDYNYQPIPNEVIWLQTITDSTLLNNKTGVGHATVNLEADSNGAIGKGVKSVTASVAITSDTNDLSFYLAKAMSLGGVGGYTVASRYMRHYGSVICDANGDIYWSDPSSGTFTSYVSYYGIQT